MMVDHLKTPEGSCAGILQRIEKNQPVGKRELFDFIREAMNKQGMYSRYGRQMLLRGRGHIKSPTGHVIPDSMYHPGLEAKRIKDLADAGKLPVSLAPHWEILDDLELLHDEVCQRLVFYFGNDTDAEFMRRFNEGIKNISIQVFGKEKGIQHTQQQRKKDGQDC